MLIGVILSYVPVVILLVNLLTQSVAGHPLVTLNVTMGMPFFVLPALSLAYGVFQNRILAELVATTYQAMGILPGRRPASWYDPGRFWSGDRIDMVPPFALGGEIAIVD